MNDMYGNHLMTQEEWEKSRIEIIYVRDDLTPARMEQEVAAMKTETGLEAEIMPYPSNCGGGGVFVGGSHDTMRMLSYRLGCGPVP